MSEKATTVPKLYDLSMIRKAVEVLFSHVKFGMGECAEVRIFDKNKRLTVSGWFDDLEAMAKQVGRAAQFGVGDNNSSRHLQESVSRL